jgi:Domain of unknown function (DUF5619)
MAECPPLRKDMLKNPIHLTVADKGLEFSRAKELADQEAGKLTAQPVLLAWYNAQTGEFSPRVTCCSEDKPAWLVYAESRGGDICIDINQEEFVFIYLPFE